MSRILMCWELGENLGHVMRLMPIARSLRNKGHQVLWAYKREHTAAACIVENEGFASLDAPAWPPPAEEFPLSQTYGQNLLKNGYREKGALRRHLDVWQSIFRSVQPHMMLAEHAPTALIAARHMGLPRAAIGTGFSIPPMCKPMPCLHPWITVPIQKMEEKEAFFLDKVNPAFEEAGYRPLESVADIFDGAERLLCTWPEFDHYGIRMKEAYLGPVISDLQGQPAPWPAHGRENVYVYMRWNHRAFAPLMATLDMLNLPVLAFVPGITESDIDCRFLKNIRISHEPVTLNDLKEKCIFAVTEGGHNTASLILLAGVPLLLCPTQLEQAVLSYRLSTQGLCHMISYFDTNPNVEAKVRQAITDNIVVENVRALAVKYEKENDTGRVEHIARKCLDLV